MGTISPRTLALALILSAAAANADTQIPDAPTSGEEPRAYWPVAPLSRVRVSTIPAPAAPGVLLEGQLVSIEGEALVLAVRGQGRVRVPQRDVASLEVRQGGSAGRGVVGGLVGLSAGFLGTILVCVTLDDVCHSVNALWVGTALGTALGAAAGAEPEWRRVPLWHHRSLALSLAPRRRGGAVGLSVSF